MVYYTESLYNLCTRRPVAISKIWPFVIIVYLQQKVNLIREGSDSPFIFHVSYFVLLFGRLLLKAYLMASTGGKKELEWIERVRSEGAVPLLDAENCRNGWSSPPADKFMVRGPEYLSNRVKVPAGEYLLKPLGFDWIRGSTKIGEVLKHPNSRVRKATEDECLTGDKPFVWAFNLQVPSKDNYSAIAYFTTKEPIPEGSLMDQFLKGDDGFRNSRLKLIANIVKGPWIVRKAVGEQAICIIGRALSCKYCVSDNFLEVDVDIGSSMVASAIVHLAFGYITTLTVDLAFLIEGQTESELPEQILGAVRFSELDPAVARATEPSSSRSAGNLQSNLPTRLWKSIGQGFSHMLHPGTQENGSSLGSAHGNGIGDHEGNSEEPKKWYVLLSSGPIEISFFLFHCEQLIFGRKVVEMLPYEIMNLNLCWIQISKTKYCIVQNKSTNDIILFASMHYIFLKLRCMLLNRYSFCDLERNIDVGPLDLPGSLAKWQTGPVCFLYVE